MIPRGGGHESDRGYGAHHGDTHVPYRQTHGTSEAEKRVEDHGQGYPNG